MNYIRYQLVELCFGLQLVARFYSFMIIGNYLSVTWKTPFLDPGDQKFSEDSLPNRTTSVEFV